MLITAICTCTSTTCAMSRNQIQVYFYLLVKIMEDLVYSGLCLFVSCCYLKSWLFQITKDQCSDREEDYSNTLNSDQTENLMSLRSMRKLSRSDSVWWKKSGQERDVFSFLATRPPVCMDQFKNSLAVCLIRHSKHRSLLIMSQVPPLDLNVLCFYLNVHL